MPPQLASLLTYSFIGWLFIRDIREKPNISNALWLPVLWVFLVATRHPSHWLALWGMPGFRATSVESGSNLDAIVYLTIIVAGIVTLLRRGFSLAAFSRNHTWLVIFLLYCLIAITWADFPFVSFKRWIKILGHPVMALVVLTEPDPNEAVKRFIKRCAYILIPVSILWIKYYPWLGRKRPGAWATQLENCGITVDKNMFGANCFVLGIFLIYFLIQTWPMVRSAARSRELRLLFALIAMNTWCFWKANSFTSWAGWIVGAAVMILMRKPGMLDRRLGLYAIVAAGFIAMAETTWDVSARINEWRGKNDTVEGRANLWKILLDMDTNPVVGTGFESFWIGPRLERMWAMPEFNAWKPNEAHNAYLEVYLTLGLIGLLSITMLFIEIHRRWMRELAENRQASLFRLGCLFGLLVYGWMEACFRGLSLGFFLLFFIAISTRSIRFAPDELVAIQDEPIADAEKSDVQQPVLI